MKKAFWIFQISNFLSLLFFSIIVINYLYPETLTWINDYLYLYFGVIIIVIYSKKWAHKFDPKAENPLSSITLCKYLQYIGVGSFIIFAVLKVLGTEIYLTIGATFSLSCMYVAYLLSFFLKQKNTKNESIIDDIEFE